MDGLPSERKALLFTVGGVRLALRLSRIREIVAASPRGADLSLHGAALTPLPVAVALGLPAGASPFLIVTEGQPAAALQVDALHGIIDLDAAEVFQLPARTHLPQPPPFTGAVVSDGALALELAVGSLGWAPIPPAPELHGPPPELQPFGERELLFRRGPRLFAVPVHLLAQVVESPVVWSVPLAPSAHRGLLYHGRALHPVIDVGVLYGERPGDRAALAILVEAGASAICVLADAVLPAGARDAEGVARPAWDALFGDA